MIDNSIHYLHGMFLEFSFIPAFVLALFLYVAAAIITSRRFEPWPHYRYLFWFLGLLSAFAAVVGPIAIRAHIHFTSHMIGHLLLGMLAPLLLALAAPVTLFLRTLRVKTSRQLSYLLKSRPIGILGNPIAASFLNVGGLWILYTTNLYTTMQHVPILHTLIHIHVFLAGYLFTVSFIYIDPTPHRTSFVRRAIVLVIALAGHSILAKYIYAHPPAGVSVTEAEAAGMLMYYGGDAIDAALIFILCYQWFRVTRPRILEIRSP